jgi:neurotransmitter:Na+ symporter, NSS family
MGKARETWGTRIGVILAVAGSAVGLGNFLRFPGQASQYGGGAFMIPYFVALILIGIPMGWAEWTMGRYGARFGFNSAPAIFGVIGRRPFWRYTGVLGLVIPLCIYMYYVYVEAWCLGYAWAYLTGDITAALGDDPALVAARSTEFFGRFVGIEHDGLVTAGGALQPAVAFWILVFALNFWLVYRGISRGIERFCIWAMPLMALCAFVVLVRVLTLDTPDPSKPDQNLLAGLAYMWNPRAPVAGQPWYHALADGEMWLAATSQVFFTLGVGVGIIVNYASYLRERDDVVLSSLTASSTNEFFEVCLGGLITIPAAFVFLGVAGATGGTFGLGFNTLPAVFEMMPATRLFGFLWFFMLFLAAVTSSISMLQPAIAFLEEGLGVGRRASVALLGLVTALGSFFVIYFSAGLAAVDTIDFWVGTALIFVLATLEVVLFGWVFGARRGYDEAHKGAELRIPRVFPFVIKYVSPVYLLIVFIFWAYDNLPGRLEQARGGGVPLYTAFLVGTLFLFLVLLTRIAGKRWRAETRDLPPPARAADATGGARR